MSVPETEIVANPAVPRARTSAERVEAIVAPRPQRVSEEDWKREPLQRGAPQNFRRHFGRAALRVGVLVTLDLATFDLLRTIRRLIGTAFASWPVGGLSLVFPQGYLSGWQFAVALIAGLIVTGNYGPGDARRDPARLTAGAALATALPLWAAFWTSSMDIVLFRFVVTSLVFAGALILERLAVDRLVQRVWHRKPVGVRTVQVVCGRDCAVIADKRSIGDLNEFRIVGQVEAGQGAARIRNLSSLLTRTRAETVMMCDHLRHEDIQRVADASMAAGCQVLVAPGVFEIAGVQPKVIWRRGDALVELTAPQLIGQQLLIKRVMDLVGAALGLVVGLPLLLLVAAIVRLDSPGPILFSQERVGQGGRRFRIFKFRTMVENAESLRDSVAAQTVYGDGRLFKVRHDPRVTRVGRFLRRSSLDELPQLLNVLRGDMALVGPRPPLPDEVALYEQHHYVRFDVKPGMTGPWQVAGRNMITDFEKVIVLETAYIREWSIWSDIRILAQTFVVVCRMKGAH